MTGELSALRHEIVETGRELALRGLAPGSSGNISVRLDDGRILVTPTNCRLGALTPERLALLDSSARHIEGGPPSKEAFLHLAVYEARPSARAIVHLHATHSAAVSCIADLDEHDCLPPLTAYYVMKIGRLPLAPYRRPGDAALAQNVGELSADHRAVLLANHGPVVAGTSLADAMNAIEELEETAKLFLTLRGSPTRPLNEEQIADLERVFGPASTKNENIR